MIGDPGGRSKERNLLDAETLARNTKRIAEQLERISRVPLVNNLAGRASSPCSTSCATSASTRASTR